jgi:hypothetical protein
MYLFRSFESSSSSDRFSKRRVNASALSLFFLIDKRF